MHIHLLLAVGGYLTGWRGGLLATWGIVLWLSLRLWVRLIKVLLRCFKWLKIIIIFIVIVVIVILFFRCCVLVKLHRRLLDLSFIGGWWRNKRRLKVFGTARGPFDHLFRCFMDQFHPISVCLDRWYLCQACDLRGAAVDRAWLGFSEGHKTEFFLADDWVVDFTGFGQKAGSRVLEVSSETVADGVDWVELTFDAENFGRAQFRRFHDCIIVHGWVGSHCSLRMLMKFVRWEELGWIRVLLLLDLFFLNCVHIQVFIRHFVDNARRGDRCLLWVLIGACYRIYLQLIQAYLWFSFFIFIRLFGRF